MRKPMVAAAAASEVLMIGVPRLLHFLGCSRPGYWPAGHCCEWALLQRNFYLKKNTPLINSQRKSGEVPYRQVGSRL